MGIKNRHGFALIELFTALVVVGIVFSVSVVFMKMFQPRSSNAIIDELESMDIFYHILKVGRLANGCIRPNLTTLDCTVDFGVFPNVLITAVRFTLNGTNLVYLQDPPNDNPDVGWIQRRVFRNVEVFDVCDDAVMSAGTCPFAELDMDAIHTGNRNPNPAILPADQRTPDGRFFRFRIRGVRSPTNALSNPSELHGAFFIRNGLVGGPPVVFSWGSGI